MGLVVAAATAVAAPSIAGAGPMDMPTSKPMKIDDIVGDLAVLHDGKGHFFAVVNVFGTKKRWAFYGTQKKLYFQRVTSTGGNKKRKTRYYHFFAPRESHSNLKLGADGKWLVTCGTRKTALTQAATPLARKVLDNAKFVERYWKRKPYALARDEWGNYYYVDRLQKQWGGKAFRLWVGQRGNMKRQRMTNIVSDSVGDIFSTRKGTLRLILNKKDATWINNKKRSSLTFVPLWPNVKLIYAELGVYPGRMGNPCDDL